MQMKWRNKTMNSWAKRLGVTLIVAGLILLAWWGVTIIRTGLSLRRHLEQTQALVEQPMDVDPAHVCDLVYELRSDVVRLDRQAGALAQLGPLLGWLPRVGGDLRAAPHLLEVADGLTEAGTLSCEAFGPALEGIDENGAAPSLEWAVEVLDQNRSSLSLVLEAVRRAEKAGSQVDIETLSSPLADRAALLDEALPLLETGLRAAQVAPDLLGATEPRTYLVLALNEDERRPIAGYITGVGEVTVEDGQLTDMTFRDVYKVDDFSQPYPTPPEPLQRYLGVDLWVFRDSNWSPDFPTVARQAIELYRPGYPVDIDGVVALDQEAVRRLVGALGQIQVPRADEAVTGDTVVSYMRQAWAPENQEVSKGWWAQRKSFMEPLAEAVWAKLTSGGVDYVRLGLTLLDLVEEKHLLLYVDHPQVESLLKEQGWDGALPTDQSGDFLMVVDANVGYNRASAKVEEMIDYQVDLRSMPPRARLTLTYTHTSQVNYPCVREIRYDPVYEQMMDRCYWDYVRVYVPEESRLVDATEIPIVEQAQFSGEGESGEVIIKKALAGPWKTFGALMLLPTGKRQVRSYVWELSPEVLVQREEGEGYTLYVEKQPGTMGHPLRVVVRLPDGARLLGTYPSSSFESGRVLFRTVLDENRDFEVRFAR